MPLSKARNRARMKLIRREKRGVPLECNLAISILPPDERKQVLKQIALHAIDKPVTAGQVIAAIREINLMEGSYAPVKHSHLVLKVVTVDYTQDHSEALGSSHKEGGSYGQSVTTREDKGEGEALQGEAESVT